jgi:UMF1 family MFS transporter
MSGRNKFTKIEKSWIMYDWANSVYATTMMAAIYPIYFVGFVNSQGSPGDTWWGIGASVSMLILAVLAPIVGALADYRGYKKKLFAAFLFLGLAFTLFSALTDVWPLMLLGFVLSRVGFSGSCLIYDSFLTDITTPDRMDRISNYGFAFGYIGGSTIPFILSIALLQAAPVIGITSSAAVKLALVITVLWWGLFSIPFLKNIKQVHYIEKPETGFIKETFAAIGRTAKKIVTLKGVFFFILAYFFYIDGVDTVISMATAYGETLGLDQAGMLLSLLVTQIVAFPCSIWFSLLAKRFTSLRMLLYAVCLYIVICIVGFIMGLGLEQNYFGLETATGLFWTLAVLVGTVQGGIQATSRSHFAKIVPPENSGEFFGFFDIFGKFAAIMGPAFYSLTKTITGSSALAILSIAILFVAALIFFAIGRKPMKEAETAVREKHG